MVGIEDDAVAFAFDMECAGQLSQWEREREDAKEIRQFELLTGQQIMSQLPRGPREVNEITSANFRDQGW